MSIEPAPSAPAAIVHRLFNAVTNKLSHVILVALYSASGCTGAEAPAASYELAAQGFYTGALSDRADLALVGSLNHGASLWRTTDQERLFNWAHSEGEYVDLVAADFSPDGTRAVTTDPRTLVLWDTSNGQALNYWGTPGAVLDVAVLNDNRRVLIGLDNHSALLFDAAAGDYEHTFLHLGEVGSVAVDGTDTYALTGSDDNTAALWSLTTGEVVRVFQHDNPVRAVALAKSSDYAFTAAQGDLVAIWQRDREAPLHILHHGINHGVMAGQFSDDARFLAVAYANRKVALFDVASGEQLRAWDSGTRHVMRATGAAILHVAFAENGRELLALAGDGRLLKLSLG